ncbi:flagellar assembly protein FliW [Parasporobacterium paucivorans]|uniref:Flagellar assembly factor FliW n=1 Tax=Parasporobacterium paucivorans DSM 15970 TaxID=1122934 RepID=A0A1M6I633_9FIRM|nr:flagellar assembly protein FliW [Parasporobacterium paucivorans]SHJ29896.1 flagellar assembly factor FliW [Parasporobacterium paucivorans DSM 15970]
MELNTKYFDTVSYEPAETVRFPEGLFGFEEYRDYLPISFHPGSDAMISLQSLLEEGPAFVLMNPFHLLKNYRPELSHADLSLLGFPREEDLSFYVICTVMEKAGESTVNLKCPVVVNSANRIAKQVILDTDLYSFRHTLADLQGKDVRPC